MNKIYRSIIISLILIGSIACEVSTNHNSATPIPATPTPTQTPISVEKIMADIELRSKGLIYMSETDSEVHAFSVPTNMAENLPENFIPALGLPDSTPYQLRTFRPWIQTSVNRDPNWAPLRDYLMIHLFDMQVYVIGDRQVMIYAVGYYRGHFIGIKMNAVET